MERVEVSEADIAEAERVTSMLASPLVPLGVQPVQGRNIFLKLENLQPVGSFKLRGAYYALHRLLHSENGTEAAGAQEPVAVYTASRGNFAQGLAWASGQLPGVRSCTVLVPEGAPLTKVERSRELGARVLHIPPQKWYDLIFDDSARRLYENQLVTEGKLPGGRMHFIHPCFHRDVIAGNGVIGLEICRQMAELHGLPDAVVTPYGGGGLTLGVATAVRATCSARGRPVSCYAAEVSTAAPLQAAFEAGAPRRISPLASFVDGIGSNQVASCIWEGVRGAIQRPLVVTPRQSAEAVRLLAETNHVIAEGAGAVPLAAALDPENGDLHGKVVCVVSGGCIDTATLVDVLRGAPLE